MGVSVHTNKQFPVLFHIFYLWRGIACPLDELSLRQYTICKNHTTVLGLLIHTLENSVLLVLMTQAEKTQQLSHVASNTTDMQCIVNLCNICAFSKIIVWSLSRWKFMYTFLGVIYSLLKYTNQRKTSDENEKYIAQKISCPQIKVCPAFLLACSQQRPRLRWHKWRQHRIMLTRSHRSRARE